MIPTPPRNPQCAPQKPFIIPLGFQRFLPRPESAILTISLNAFKETKPVPYSRAKSFPIELTPAEKEFLEHQAYASTRYAGRQDVKRFYTGKTPPPNGRGNDVCYSCIALTSIWRGDELQGEEKGIEFVSATPILLQRELFQLGITPSGFAIEDVSNLFWVDLETYNALQNEEIVFVPSKDMMKRLIEIFKEDKERRVQEIAKDWLHFSEYYPSITYIYSYLEKMKQEFEIIVLKPESYPPGGTITLNGQSYSIDPSNQELSHLKFSTGRWTRFEKFKYENTRCGPHGLNPLLLILNAAGTLEKLETDQLPRSNHYKELIQLCLTAVQLLTNLRVVPQSFESPLESRGNLSRDATPDLTDNSSNSDNSQDSVDISKQLESMKLDDSVASKSLKALQKDLSNSKATVSNISEFDASNEFKSRFDAQPFIKSESWVREQKQLEIGRARVNKMFWEDFVKNDQKERELFLKLD